MTCEKAYVLKHERTVAMDAEELAKYSPEISDRFLKNRNSCRSFFFPGWKNIILEINTELKKIAPEYTISQIKPKFGSLTFYFECNVDNFQEALNLVGKISKKSYTTCSSCGGEKLKSGFTLCDKCKEAVAF